MIPIVVGFDQREAVAYHVFCQSVLEHASEPVCFIPLTNLAFDGQRDGTNRFIYSRYIIPYLLDYNGWAIFCDGDMVVNQDIAELWRLRDSWNKAIMVVKHDYKTQHRRKFIGSPLENDNIDYPRKNWSSVMLWNCGHYANRILTPDFVADQPGSFLHRFQWLKDEQIGELPATWNHLVREQPHVDSALDHFTLGVPGFQHYELDGENWHQTLLRTLNLAGETPADMVKRATAHQ